MKQKFALAFFLIIQFFFSCSLNYRTVVEDPEDKVPELTFSNAIFTRYENRKRTMDFSAAEIEQYSDGTRLFAKDITFTIFDSNGNSETTGKCGLLSSNTNNGNYELYDDIQITNTTREITLQANVLRWNENTEQLTGSHTDTVTLVKNDTTIHGKGFSASAVSNSFAFGGNIYGVAITNEEETDE